MLFSKNKLETRAHELCLGPPLDDKERPGRISEKKLRNKIEISEKAKKNRNRDQKEKAWKKLGNKIEKVQKKLRKMLRIK